MPPCNALKQAVGACIVNGDTCDPHKAIFSREQLSVLCTREVISGVLNCACSQCLEHASCIGIVYSAEAAARLIIGNEHYPSLLLTFCVLVYIDCPRFIHSCLKEQHLLNDISIGNRTDGFSLKDLHRNIWSDYKRKDPEGSKRFANNFWWTKRHFFVPYITGDSFDVYDQSDLLPFVDEKPLYTQSEDGEEVQEHGAFGKVFSFQIIPEYNLLTPSFGLTCVRKELFGTSANRFHNERHNLELVRRLQDPHLVKLLKSYRHGNTFNFIFLQAKTNLGCYLRDPRFGASSSCCIPIESSPLWKQALGIAKALSNVINYTPPGNAEPLYGYHFDLKPANVLVGHDDILLISDFGQARFQTIGDTSRITPIGGTEAYAPPEADTVAERYNRKYDVWSLGCMFLEICSFVVKGYDGVKTLDRIRVTKSGNRTDDRFFNRVDKEIYEIKPDIAHWLESLPQSEHVRTWHSREFLQEIVELIERMMHPVISKRIAAKVVFEMLEAILQRYQPDGANSLPDMMPRVALEDGDLEYAPQITRRVRSMLCFEEGRWIPSRLKIFEDEQRDVHILSTNTTAKTRVRISSRSSLKVVPRYASHSRLQEGYSDCHLYFLMSISGSEDAVIQTTKLYFQDPKESHLAHSAFIGQDILSTLSIQQCTINQHTPIFRRFSRQDANFISEVPTTIELWHENSYSRPSLLSQARPRRSVRQNVFSEPALRRIVIYSEKSILIIRFAKNVRLKHIEKGDKPNSIKIVPTEPHRDPSFMASMLKPKRAGTVAGIPISSRHLDGEEEDRKFECKSVEIVFHSEQDRKAFYNAYRRMKEEWKNEDKQLEPFRRNMGSILGYSPI